MSLLDALIQVESAGIPGRLGPKTKYGQAQGLTQMLPGTAREMAQKLGMPWRPDLMTAPTDEGAAYQRELGNAYLQQGMERTGNERDALRYYHGGPNRQLWGPNTNAYADKVMGLAGNEQQMMPQQQRPPVFGGEIEEQPLEVSSQGPLAGMMQMDPASLPQPQNIKPGAFDKGGKGWIIAGIIADAIAGGFGGKGGFAPAYTAMQDDERQMAAWREKVAADREERMQPRLMQAGGNILSVDPSNNHVTPVYQTPPEAPEPTTLERNIEFYRQQNPGATDEQIAELIRQSIGDAPQQPKIITYNSGNETITAQVNPDGSRTVIGRGPRWQPASRGGGASLPPGFILDGGE